MSKRTEKKLKAMREKRAAKARAMKTPGWQSKYAKKGRASEIGQGYSTRETSPFYLPPSQRESGDGLTLPPPERSWAA